MRKYLVLGLTTGIMLLPLISNAAIWHSIVPGTDQGSSCGKVGGCQSICDIALLVQNILNDAIVLATFMAGILFAWAGGRMLMAGGDPKAITSAKKTFSAVLIGFIIILSAWLIVDTIMKVFTDQSSSGFGPWNQICQ
ncbi:MAG: hypothetical protein JWO50_555 [Candidatus Kaiserbacteria bacterium]|nr:hypothetical protein [Candidatus Kaiserbacteria bacterium]